MCFALSVLILKFYCIEKLGISGKYHHKPHLTYYFSLFYILLEELYALNYYNNHIILWPRRCNAIIVTVLHNKSTKLKTVSAIIVIYKSVQGSHQSTIDFNKASTFNYSVTTLASTDKLLSFPRDLFVAIYQTTGIHVTLA